MKTGLMKVSKSKEIFLKGEPLELLTPIGTFYLILDVDQKMIQVQVPEGFKLGFVNGLDIALGGDLDIDSIGEVNLVTRGKNINIDSLEAAIYLNSLKSKQTRDDPNWDSQRNELMEIARSKRDEIEHQKKHSCSTERLLELVSDLTERVERLEKENAELRNITMPFVPLGPLKNNPF